jgi:hypothetical protein
MVVIGLALFLEIKLQTMGPAGKVLSGFSVSVALLAAGVWLELKAAYRIFARALIGGGWALAFFTTFAMHHLAAARVIHSLATDLVLMLLVAAGMVAHSLRYRSQTVTGLAFGLGFATLLTSHLENSDGTVVFSLTAAAVLALALVVVTTLRHWAWLELAGLIAIYLSHFIWLTRVLPDSPAPFAQFWPSTALILFYWLIFRLAYVLRKPVDKTEENISSLSAVFNSMGVLGLLKYEATHPEWAFWALAALGACEMALAFWVRPRRRQGFVVLSTIAAVLLVAAVPFRFHGVSWPVLWLVEAQVLALAGLRLGEPVFRRLGLLAGIVTAGVLAFHNVLPLLLFRLDHPDPVLHFSLIVALALAALLFWNHAEVYPHLWPEIVENENEAFALYVTSWLGAASGAAALWVALPFLWFPIGWLALAILLGFAAYRFSASMPALQGDVLALVAGIVLISFHIVPALFFRLQNPLPTHDLALTAALAVAAVAFFAYSELYPRLLPHLYPNPAFDLDLSDWEGFAKPAANWLGATAAAAAIWAALPDLWVPVGWIALVLLLSFAARYFQAIHPAIEAALLALLAGSFLIFDQIFPLAALRLSYPDPSHHGALALVLTISALAFWAHSEALPRLIAYPDFDESPSPAFLLAVSSWLGVAAAAAALWVTLPIAWIVPAWLALSLLVGLAADLVEDPFQALQADLLAIAAVLALFPWNLGSGEGFWQYKAPLIAVVILLYAGMRRKTPAVGSRNYMAPTYSCAATGALAITANIISSDSAVTPAWVALGLVLFEIGRFSRKPFLRWQGFFLVFIAFFRCFMHQLADGVRTIFEQTQRLEFAAHFSFTNSLLLDVLVLAAGGYWLLERTRDWQVCVRRERIAGLIADALGTLSIAVWFGFRFPSYWVPVPGGEVWVTVIWAGMATLLMALAWLMRRRAFLVQALVLAVAVVLRGFFIDLLVPAPQAFWHGPLLHLSLAALILMAALPFAFGMRGDLVPAASSFQLPAEIEAAVRRPEQWFFFAPFVLIAVALAVKLSSGHITIAWSLLGLAIFLFALAVGERSFRLTGLGLLMVSVVKILLMDMWRLPLPDRFLTMVILGTALTLVSFLYTRFSKVIRKYL